VLYDLDIGMNERLCEPLAWDDSRRYDRGKVLSYQDLEAGKRFGRYLDLDGDGITYRTTRHAPASAARSSPAARRRDRYARYTEEGSAYVDNMQRLLKKFETAKELVPGPVVSKSGKGSRFGVIYYGSTAPAMDEALAAPRGEAHARRRHARARLPVRRRGARLRAPHDHVFVVEQNRDAQLRTLLVAEGMLPPEKLTPVLHYDGTPITARFIHREIASASAPSTCRRCAQTAGVT
jgi:2-oxoglutarate ferredoxin oxidoreductase subunit alpha